MAGHRLVSLAGKRLMAAVTLAFDSVAALPADAQDMLAAAARREFQLSAAWFAAVAAAALPVGARPLLLLYREDDRALALLALQRSARGRLTGLTAPYTSVFRPLAAPDATPADLERAGYALGRFCRGHGAMRLDALDSDWPGMAPLLAGLRRAGMIASPFAHFGNWHVCISGTDWRGYLQARPGTLRNTIRRRLDAAQRDPSVTFEAVAGGAALPAGIAAYERVYARSWKQPEPYPKFAPGLLRAAADARVLRLGLLKRDGLPVAAQYWILSDGCATVIKLAHDEAERAWSPGTVLTALMIRRLLEQDSIQELDFGRGDDEYKAAWTGQRRQRYGLTLAAWWQPSGLALLGRSVTRRRTDAATFVHARERDSESGSQD